MTDRHPMDCYVTPPCAAIAIGKWLEERWPHEVSDLDWLDPFAGPGTLLPWMLRAEHKRLALLAYQMGRETVEGAA